MRYTLIILTIFAFNYTKSQTYTILSLDDTNYYSKNIKQDFGISLKDSLPDGCYKLLSNKNNKFSKKSRLLLSGCYCNGVKNGLFITNYYAKHRQSSYLMNKTSVFFTNGKKHGISEELLYLSRNDHPKILIHEEYEFGSKNGIFIYNNKYGAPREVRYYYLDTLVFSCEYSTVLDAQKLFEFNKTTSTEYIITRYSKSDSICKVTFRVNNSVLISYSLVNCSNENIKTFNCFVNIGNSNIDLIFENFKNIRYSDFLVSSNEERIAHLEHCLK